MKNKQNAFEYYKDVDPEKTKALLNKLSESGPLHLIPIPDNGYLLNYKGYDLLFRQKEGVMSWGEAGSSVRYLIPESLRSEFYKIIWVEEIFDELLSP